MSPAGRVPMAGHRVVEERVSLNGVHAPDGAPNNTASRHVVARHVPEQSLATTSRILAYREHDDEWRVSPLVLRQKHAKQPLHRLQRRKPNSTGGGNGRRESASLKLYSITTTSSERHCGITISRQSDGVLTPVDGTALFVTVALSSRARSVEYRSATRFFLSVAPQLMEPPSTPIFSRQSREGPAGGRTSDGHRCDGGGGGGGGRKALISSCTNTP